MDSIITAIIQGIVEGLTEFLPVSSTGHLILSGKLLGFTGEKADTFEIIIQLGAILAVAVIYYRRILALFGLASSKESSAPATSHKLNLIHIILACLPAMVLGLVLHSVIKNYLFSPYTVLIGLVVGGVFMLYGQKRQATVQAEGIDELSYKQAFLIGLFQCLALWPGFSRSGATIAGGLLIGASYRAATNFSFLVAIPMMIAASGYELLKSYKLLTADDAMFFLTGFVVAFVVALLAVLTFLKLLERFKLAPFAYYRFVLAAVFFIYLISS
ncbi:undecaprenyl-diphosphatase 1 [Paenibacillus baekrokdamisoli]|uniref:Undecaprenyl-diphosphatase n=1 Tax=Paenibacillus baekrokdamisoli TaxID=1712516 RepID=A0A3G9J780_9BACL|nr:undecaprenyl-diphosphate phosphatase [Paenibacillus baekrokdamisoli]MBB3069934.1 undecaprenyl-diphosphatase [Paenibacillus baekrokdamisoli]BBH20713.1 undecaprenyl-diphosphatase 1 [Paenibacillus baekrokdamisoli]